MSQYHELNKLPHGLPIDILADVVVTFKALSDPTRAQLIYLLTQQEHSVNELSRFVNVSASAVSHHLAKLRGIRLVRTRREGNQVFYSIDDSHLAALFREALYHLEHVQQNLPDHPGYSDTEKITDEKGAIHETPFTRSR
jgi:DNA-binding transcriptional ArsR family regulator